MIEYIETCRQQRDSVHCTGIKTDRSYIIDVYQKKARAPTLSLGDPWLEFFFVQPWEISPLNNFCLRNAFVIEAALLTIKEDGDGFSLTD